MRLEDTIVYQIYPKSFKDSTGNGLGDLRGIIDSFDYIVDLGVNMVWFNPFYPSPQYDNGYDISDYKAINPDYGTMADFEELVALADSHGIGIMMDMVLNHCSTEHEWFQKALAGDPYYQDFFYLRPAKEDGSLPTNWDSKFGGPAWEPFGDTGLYYLHLYEKHMADLNWHNPNVRRELFDVVRFWCDKGVKGLRFDVLNVIGKDELLVDSDQPGSAQEKALYTDRPIVHEWIKEMKRESFGQYEGIITVGEMSSTTVANGIKYSDPAEDELSMLFSFHHLKVDYADGEKWTNPPFDFIKLKAILDQWQQGLSDGNGWNAIFLNNHDQPRSNSRFGDVETYPYETATMLAQTIQFLRGTPYIYQGEEIGMTDPGFDSIEDYRDVETLNHYQILQDKGYDKDETMAIIQSKSRDNSRTPMQWDDSENAGFTSETPWLPLAPNYPKVNVAQEEKSNNILAYYKELIRLRKEEDLIKLGSYQGLMLDHPEVMAYLREYQGRYLLVLSHFYPGEVTFDLVDLPFDLNQESRYLIGNGSHQTLQARMTLGAYETVAFVIE